jgi:hypothetical protein
VRSTRPAAAAERESAEEMPDAGPRLPRQKIEYPLRDAYAGSVTVQCALRGQDAERDREFART